MSNPPKKKGTAAESALVGWLRDHGHPGARRNAPAGNRDEGDIGGVVVTAPVGAFGTDEIIDELVVEVKSYADVARAINDGLAELDVEMANAGAAHGVLVVKRRGKSDPGEWLAVRRVRNDPELGVGA